MVKLNIVAGGGVAFIASHMVYSVNPSPKSVRQNLSRQITAWIEKAAVRSSKLHGLPAFATVVDAHLEF